MTMNPATNRIKPATPEVLTELRRYRDIEGLSTSTLGKQLGYSGSQVSRYLNDEFGGDLDKFEAKAADILRVAPIRRIVSAETFETGVTRTIHGSIQGILETNDFAVIHGPAGIGKTVAAARYHAENPNSFFITLSQDANNAHYIRKQLFNATKTRAYTKSGKTHGEWILEKIKGSNRLIIIDNGHRITSSGRKFLFDLHDASGCPVVMIGNPEILDQIKINDQQFSRIGMCPPEVELEKTEIADIAERILDQDCPDHAEELLAYAITVASKRGHLRALRKQIKLTLYFMERGVDDAREAFRAAHAALVRDYSL